MKTGRPRWPSYDPGRLQHLLLILQQAPQVDEMGQNVQVFYTVATVRGAIDDAVNETKPLGREYYQSGFIASRVTHIITIRWLKNVQILAGMRVYFVDQRYSPPAVHSYFIEFVENAENRDVLLRLGCWEINDPA